MFSKIVLLLFVCCIDAGWLESIGNGTLQTYNENSSGKVLSRKKRYLIFPEGSSLQLVYCLTMPSLGMGSIFTIGSTAALAWQLPHDPFVPFRPRSELLHRVDDNVQKTPVKSHYDPLRNFYQTINMRTPMVQPYSTIPLNAWNKRTDWGYQKVPIQTYVHPVYQHVHRRTRRDLYGKLEKFLTALRKDGKACLLKAICEVSQAAQKKGSFMEEIIKAIFRVKPHENYANEDDYDFAFNKSHNCTEMYTSCEHSVWNDIL